MLQGNHQSVGTQATTAGGEGEERHLFFMHGGASHVDTFDPKPELTRMSGKPISAEAARD